ncbi:thioredoxin-like protein 4B isoform X1 [Pongo pygmaeus]
MSFLLPKLTSKKEVDQAIKSTAEKVLVLRFGRDEDPVCLQLDDILSKTSSDLSKMAAIYLVDVDHTPVYTQYFDISYIPSTVFFFNGQHMKVDYGVCLDYSGSFPFYVNFKINFPVLMKCPDGIFIGITLNLQITLGFCLQWRRSSPRKHKSCPQNQPCRYFRRKASQLLVITGNIGRVLCARHCAMCFLCIYSFNSSTAHKHWVFLLSNNPIFYKWGTERIRNLFKVTQLVKRGARIQTQAKPSTTLGCYLSHIMNYIEFSRLPHMCWAQWLMPVIPALGRTCWRIA